MAVVLFPVVSSRWVLSFFATVRQVPDRKFEMMLVQVFVFVYSMEGIRSSKITVRVLFNHCFLVKHCERIGSTLQ